MTQGQRESFFFVYISVCNALLYAENLMLENISKPARDSIRIIKDRLNWIKKSMDMRVNADKSIVVDTLRYDAVIRLLCNLPDEYQDRLEDLLYKFVRDIEEEIKNGGNAPDHSSHDATSNVI
jgi:hypothetical protein